MQRKHSMHARHLQIDVEHSEAHARTHRGDCLVNEVDTSALEEDERVALQQHELDRLELLVAASGSFTGDVDTSLVLGKSDVHGEWIRTAVHDDAPRAGSGVLVLVTLVNATTAATTAATAAAATVTATVGELRRRAGERRCRAAGAAGERRCRTAAFPKSISTR
jgi:hypothetical protein